MELIKEARLHSRITRVQCGWEFSPRICVEEDIVLAQDIAMICDHCKVEQQMKSLDDFCESCYDGNVFENYDKLNDKISNFDVEFLAEKDTKYLDRSTLYKIKVDEFFGLLFCGVFEEPNEWSSSPHDDYWCITFLFKDIDECNAQYESLKIIDEYINK
jgi:hypothetical protein